MPQLDLLPILNALQTVVGTGRAALHEPCFAGNEWGYVRDCLDSGWVSSVGAYVDKFERGVAEFTGAKFVIAVVNGTSALHVGLRALGIGAGVEVLCPALTFVATANAISYLGATPHFVDSCEETLGMDPRCLAEYLNDIAILRAGECVNRFTGSPIRAVIPMHAFGHPVDMDPLVDISERWNLEVIEDAAESLGSLYKGRHTGLFGRLATLSFNGNKIISTGGGGAILTDDPMLAKRVRHLATTARVPDRWGFVHDEIGYNYRMPNLNAALGCAQLEQLPEFVHRKRELAGRYAVVFSDIEGVRFFREQEFARSNYWLNVLLLDDRFSNSRDVLLERTNAMGVSTRPVWTLMSKLQMFSKCPRMPLKRAESLERRIVNIPSSAALGRVP